MTVGMAEARRGTREGPPGMPTWFEMETVERRAWEDVYRAASGAGMRGAEMVGLGRGAALFTPGLDVLAMNRAFGFAPGDVSLAALCPALVEAFRVRDIPRFFFQLLPGGSERKTAETLMARGFRPYNRWVRLHRPAGDGDVPWVVTGLRVVRAGPEHARAFGEINQVSFGFPEGTVPWMAALVGRAGWHAFVALDGGAPVATGAFHVQGAHAWMGFSATLPAHRGRGAQLALLAEMVLQAGRAGCRHLIAETAEDRPDHPAPAYRNGLRLGFREAYRRENWLYDRLG